MLISLRKQAKTTPKIRGSREPAWLLAECHGISERSVWKCRGRDGVLNRSHTPHRLQTTLTPAQEAVAVAREFLKPNFSLSELDSCLRRQGAGNLRALKSRESKPERCTFMAYEPGYRHIASNTCHI